MRITTWNANSVRLREAMLARITEELKPDVLCLQEVKVEDAKFPTEMIETLGYTYRYLHGQKAYHGVAVLSRVPLEDAGFHKWCGIDEARHAWVRLPGDVELHNIYVPAGGDEPDPKINPKFKHKLDMVGELGAWFTEIRDDAKRRVVVGDLNIAPLPTDVWSHKQLLKIVSHTPVETEALDRWRDNAGLIDAVRQIIPPEEKLFSWWSYRNRDWSKSDRGRRLDHVWLTPALVPNLRHAQITREARGWEKPSDHVPVTIDLDI